jgi:hypothetical protein
MDMKTCSKCKTPFPDTTEYFYIATYSGKTENICKQCKKDYAKSKYVYVEKKPVKKTIKKKKCRICHNVFPATTEHFTVHKSYKDGLNTRCKTCQNAYDRAKYAKRRAKESKGYNPIGNYSEYQELVKQKDEKEEEIFNRLVNEKVVAGVYIKDVKLNVGQAYKVQIAVNKQKGLYVDHFQGVMVQDNKNNIVLKHKRGYCETFLKADLLIGEYKIKEVSI